MKEPIFIFDSPSRNKLTLLFPLRLTTDSSNFLADLISSHKQSTYLFEDVDVIAVVKGSDNRFINILRQGLGIPLVEMERIEMDRLIANGYVHPLNNGIISSARTQCMARLLDSVPFKLWVCREHPGGEVAWNGDVATCKICKASNDESD